MAFVKLEISRGSGRPSAEVRVVVSSVRSTRQLGVIMAESVMAQMGVELRHEMDLHIGEGEDAGWIRVETASGRNGRAIGKLPQTASGLVKFPLPASAPYPPTNSTDVTEWRIEPGALTLRLPAALLGDRPAFVAPPVAKPPVARAIPLVERPEPAAAAPPAACLTASDKIKAGIAAAKLAREAGIPRDGSGGKASKHAPPLETDAADPDERDRLEAMQELRKGKSVRDVARDFGFKLATVAGWQEQVLAERAKGRAA